MVLIAQWFPLSWADSTNVNSFYLIGYWIFDWISLTFIVWHLHLNLLIVSFLLIRTNSKLGALQLSIYCRLNRYKPKVIYVFTTFIIIVKIFSIRLGIIRFTTRYCISLFMKFTLIKMRSRFLEPLFSLNVR